MNKALKAIVLITFVLLIYSLVQDSLDRNVPATPKPDRSAISKPDSNRPPAATQGVVADKFDVSASIRGTKLTLSLDTDLPDDTVLSIIVGRSYWETGNDEEYSRSYFEEDSTVGAWKTERSVDISADIWRNSLKNFQAEMDRAGLGFKVGRISDNIYVYAVVPINGQTNPSFGERNKYLTGKAVTEQSYGNSVKKELTLLHPL